jgi:hypothetical protein
MSNRKESKREQCERRARARIDLARQAAASSRVLFSRSEPVNGRYPACTSICLLVELLTVRGMNADLGASQFQQKSHALRQGRSPTGGTLIAPLGARMALRQLEANYP